VEVYLQAFSTSALNGGEWSASRSGRFTPKEITFGTQWIGGCVGPRASLDAAARRKKLQRKVLTKKLIQR